MVVGYGDSIYHERNGQKGMEDHMDESDKREYFNLRGTKMTKIAVCITLRNFVVRPSGLLTGGYVARYRLLKFREMKLYISSEH